MRRYPSVFRTALSSSTAGRSAHSSRFGNFFVRWPSKIAAIIVCAPTTMEFRSVSSAMINRENLAVFEAFTGAEWADERTGPLRPLHTLNRLRVPWIATSCQKSQFDSTSESLATHDSAAKTKVLLGVRLLDVGCGSGLLSLALCRLGADIVGLDVNAEALAAADRFATTTLSEEERARMCFHVAPIEEFAAQNGEAFDGVIASEVLEHVADVEAFIHNCVALVQPKAKLLFTTLNKTLASRFLAITMAELKDLLSIVPRGVHDYKSFVEPERLRAALLAVNCRAAPPLGMLYNPLTNRWSWTGCTAVGYALTATKF